MRNASPNGCEALIAPNMNSFSRVSDSPSYPRAALVQTESQLPTSLNFTFSFTLNLPHLLHHAPLRESNWTCGTHPLHIPVMAGDKKKACKERISTQTLANLKK